MSATSNVEPPAPAEPCTDRYERGRINVGSSVPFFIFHLIPLLAIFTGVSWTAAVLLVITFWGRMFFITGGYHRYFSHRAYKTSRAFQFVLAFGGGMSVQKGALWWAGSHRLHHRFSDQPQDPHTPKKGFWWSHMGWILCDETSPTPTHAIKDFNAYPELRFLNRYDWIPWVTLALFCLAVGGWSGLVIGFFLSTVLLWHSTFLINSLAHVFGSRRYETTDTSRNNLWLALLTMGEGWHNNHHHAAWIARQGLTPGEIDMTWYILLLLEKVGVIWDVKRPRNTNVKVDASAGV
ncbi:MAG: acyl-CoA desaturase [Microthrixaceae bacterium]